MAADKETLEQLHDLFAKYLLALLEPVENEDGEMMPASLSAPTMSVISKFLKDNNVAATDEDDDEVAELKAGLRSTARKQGFNQEDIDLALEGAQYGTAH